MVPGSGLVALLATTILSPAGKGQRPQAARQRGPKTRYARRMVQMRRLLPRLTFGLTVLAAASLCPRLLAQLPRSPSAPLIPRVSPMGRQADRDGDRLFDDLEAKLAAT